MNGMVQGGPSGKLDEEIDKVDMEQIGQPAPQ